MLRTDMKHLPPMNFCSQCGGVVSIRTPDGDTLPRHVCDGCGHIHYSNPKLVVGCIAEWEEKILLCRRAIEPRLGLWTIPAGFMENLETSEQAAARETLEEACAQVSDLVPYGLYDLPKISQVYLIYRARMATPDHGPGHESLERSSRRRCAATSTTVPGASSRCTPACWYAGSPEPGPGPVHANHSPHGAACFFVGRTPVRQPAMSG